MKKPAVLTLSALAIAAAAYGGATWWAGKQAEAFYQDQIERLQHSYPGLKVIDHRYTRGLLHATSVITLQYGRADSADSTADAPSDHTADTPADESASAPASDADADADALADQEGEEPIASAPAETDESDDGTGSEEDEEETAAPPLYLTLVLTDHISHGPITSLHSLGAARVDSTLTLDARSTPEIAATLAGQTLATAQTDVGFSGDFSSVLQGPALQWATPGGEQMSWQGFDGTLASAEAGSKASYELTAPGLRLDNAEQGMHMGFSSLSLRGIGKSMDALWALSGRDEGQIGAIDLAVDETADDGQPFAVALKNVQFQQTNKASGDLLDGLLQVTGSGQAGELPINRFELRTSLTRLHAPTYLRMAEQVAGLSSDDAEGAAQVMRANLAALLAYNPEYALDKLAVEIDGQSGELSYRLGMPGVTPEEQEVPLSLLALSRLHLDAQASVPVSWLEWMARESALDDGGTLTPAGARALLDELVKQGLLVREGKDRVKTVVRYDKGRLEVNGKPVKNGLGALGSL
ncbi:MAG: DUF945 family protein [Comamonas sp.]